MSQEMSVSNEKNIIDVESLEVSPSCVSKNSSFKSSSELFAFGSIIVSLGFIAACYMIYPSITTKIVYKHPYMEDTDEDDDIEALHLNLQVIYFLLEKMVYKQLGMEDSDDHDDDTVDANFLLKQIKI